MQESNEHDNAILRSYTTVSLNTTHSHNDNFASPLHKKDFVENLDTLTVQDGEVDIPIYSRQTSNGRSNSNASFHVDEEMAGLGSDTMDNDPSIRTPLLS